MAAIFLIDSDRALMNDLADLLTAEGHDVRAFADPEAAQFALARQTPDLVVMELRHPTVDMLTMFERLRDDHGVPTVLLSKTASVPEEAMVMRLGAADYLGKPFSARVLTARVWAAIQRGPADQKEPDDLVTLQRGPLHLDRLRHEVRWNGLEVPLTATEFSVLWTIAQRPGQVLSRANILDLAYGNDAFVTDRSIDSQVKRIRRKLREVAPDFNAIETLYGLGYRFTDVPNNMAA